MAKDFSAFLGSKKDKKLDLLGTTDSLSNKTSSNNKPKTNLRQSEDKLETQLSTNLVQAKGKHRENIEITQRKRSEQPGENVEISQRKRRDLNSNTFSKNKKRRDKGGENVEISQRKRSEQPGENVEIKKVLLTTDPTLLVGTQRKVFVYLVELTQSYASLTTPPLTLDALSVATELKSGQIHTATKELRKKGCICIDKRKDGRGGWVSYRVEKEAYESWVRLNSKHIRRENVEKTQRKRSEQPGDKGGDLVSSSSSVQKNKSTTTSDELWKTLDLSIVEKMGINQSAIFEAQQKFGPFDFIEFENFLERFSKYMADSKKSRSIGNARGFFFSLCKQMREGIEPLSEIETDGDLALKNLLEEKKKAKIERDKLKRKLLEFEFEEWFEGLSNQEKEEIQPENSLIQKGSEPYLAVFRSYFEGNIWAQK